MDKREKTLQGRHPNIGDFLQQSRKKYCKAERIAVLQVEEQLKPFKALSSEKEPAANAEGCVRVHIPPNLGYNLGSKNGAGSLAAVVSAAARRMDQIRRCVGSSPDVFPG